MSADTKEREEAGPATIHNLKTSDLFRNNVDFAGPSFTLSGLPGNPGDVLTSHGVGTKPSWTSGGGSGVGGAVTNPHLPYATAPNTLGDTSWLYYPADGVFQGPEIAVQVLISRSHYAHCYSTFTTNYVVLPTDQNVLMNAAFNPVNVNLPPATTPANILPYVGFAVGLRLSVIKIDASTNTVTILPNGGDLINGGTSLVLVAQYGVTLQSDGNAHWWTV
jgi:hypothetical protein